METDPCGWTVSGSAHRGEKNPPGHTHVRAAGPLPAP